MEDPTRSIYGDGGKWRTMADAVMVAPFCILLILEKSAKYGQTLFR